MILFPRQGLIFVRQFVQRRDRARIHDPVCHGSIVVCSVAQFFWRHRGLAAYYSEAERLTNAMAAFT
jgi:hypothetical protein